jgi:hypothetical protein
MQTSASRRPERGEQFEVGDMHHWRGFQPGADVLAGAFGSTRR